MLNEKSIYLEEAAFSASLFQRLQEFSPKFHQIRERMGIGNRVGLGMLPQGHLFYSAGRLISLKGSDAELSFLCPDGFLSCEYKILTPEQQCNIIIMPDLSHPAPYLISIYQRKGWWDQQSYEPKLLDAPDDVIVGLIAHEMAHFSELDEELTEKDRMKAVLARWDKEFKALSANGCETTSDFFHINEVMREGKIDLIAALHGYKPQILAKLEYMITCFRNYMGPRSASIQVTPTELIRECDDRKRAVNKYYPAVDTNP